MKKFLTILLTVVLTAAVAITGTVAYLTAEDSDVNVMTLGNVKIEQNEYERKEDGSLGEFTQNKPAYPAVGPIEWAAKGVVVNGVEYKVFTEDLKNVVDKIVTVENTSKSDAYVRTIIALEAPDFDPNDLIHINHNSTGVTMGNPVLVKIGGADYVVFEFVYDEALAAGEESAPSLVQVFLDAKATNEDCEAFGETWEIIAISQAVQVEGFADAKTALNTAFGEVNANNAALIEAFLGTLNYVPVTNAAELKEAIEAAAPGETTTIVLANDVEANIVAEQNKDANIVIDGNGHKFTGSIVVDGDSARYETATFVIRNVNFTGTLSEGADACIRLGDGSNKTRYTNNVTIENCTFDAVGAVGVKSYTGGDKNLVIKDCVATANAHSLAQLANVEEGLVIEGCVINSKNGINVNQSVNVVISGCTANVRGYAVRFGASSGATGAAETYLIENSTLNTDGTEGDAAIILRGTAESSTLTVVNSTYSSIDNQVGATVIA